jgi:hypothetical protein
MKTGWSVKCQLHLEVRSRRPAGKGWLKARRRLQWFGGDLGNVGSYRVPTIAFKARFDAASAATHRGIYRALLWRLMRIARSRTRSPGRLSRSYTYEATKEKETPESIPSEPVVGYTQV